MGIWKPGLFSVETKQPFISLKPNALRVKTTPAEILISTQACQAITSIFFRWAPVFRYIRYRRITDKDIHMNVVIGSESQVRPN